MNSPLPDRTLRTSCKNCIFSVYEGITQTGCDVNRLELFKNAGKIIEAYDNEKEFYVIEGLCNFNRPLTWNNGVASKDKVLEESSPTFKVYIDCTNIDESLEKKIVDLIDSKYYTSKFTVTLYHELNVDKNIKQKTIQIYKMFPKMVYLSSCRDKDEFIHNGYLNAKECYLINIKDGENFDTNILSKVNDLINSDLKKALLIKNKDAFIISNTLYRVENWDTPHSGYNKTKETLVNKLKDTNLYFEI
jgi:hypothetical protein